MGTPGMPSPALIGDNLVFAQVAVNNVPGVMVVDTGAPIALVDPTQFPGAGLPAMAVTNASYRFGTFTVDAVPTYSDTADPLPAGGLVGGNLLRQFSAQFDYRDQTLRIGDGTSPSGVETPGGAVNFTLQGGGRGRISMKDPNSIVTFPATRIPVTVDVEGTTHPCILDTGATAVVLRTTAFGALTADGRPTLDTTNITTVYGMMTGHFSRAKTVTVAGEAVTSNPPVLNVGDDLLDSLTSETGHTVDCLLGGTFLREFLVTVDYPKGVLHLQRYSPPVVVADEFRRVGIELGAAPSTSTHTYAVGSVYPGSDAQAKQVSINDELIDIDGQALDSLDPFTVERMLLGAVGSTHAVHFGITSVAANQNQTITILVDDLLPNPT